MDWYTKTHIGGGQDDTPWTTTMDRDDPTDLPRWLGYFLRGPLDHHCKAHPVDDNNCPNTDSYYPNTSTCWGIKPTPWSGGSFWNISLVYKFVISYIYLLIGLQRDTPYSKSNQHATRFLRHNQCSNTPIILLIAINWHNRHVRSLLHSVDSSIPFTPLFFHSFSILQHQCWLIIDMVTSVTWATS